MPVPKRKRSRARRDSRFANKGVEVKELASCRNCQAAIEPHQVCTQCGHYKGVKVMVTKLERTIKRGQTRKVLQEKAQARQKT
ncbi:50S ribosomal protein L32, partial [Candidatus Dependentiae bacterium HGW-Dependentiae-1]